MERRRVVITGLGTVNPVGNTVAETWENVKNGVCGIAPIRAFDTEDFAVKVAGEVKDLDIPGLLGRKESKRMDRFTQLAMVAAREAFKDSGLNMENDDPDRSGVIMAAGIGGLNTIESEHNKGQAKGYNMLSPYFIPMSIGNMAAGQIAIDCGLRGMCSCIVTACAGGTNAVGEAFHHIRDGYSDVMLAGGSESCVTKLGVGGFAALQALNLTDDPNRASIPFDKERAGFVLGEGAGVLVLEELQHAKARGAKIYAEIAGYGANCDAYHITAPEPTGRGGAECMKLCVKDADMQPEEIDYINAHGTSTPLNDSGETKAIKSAFGDHAYKLMVSSTKSMTGHLLGGAGAVEAVITALTVADDFVPATINYKVPDENCDLDIVPNTGRQVKVNAAISNSLGFGGHNASILIRKYME